MRLVFAGTPEVALPSLDAIAKSGHELLAVVTRPDAPSGRGPADGALARGRLGRRARHRGAHPGPAA